MGNCCSCCCLRQDRTPSRPMSTAATFSGDDTIRVEATAELGAAQELRRGESLIVGRSRTENNDDKDEKVKRFKNAEKLREYLQPWISGAFVASGISIEDQTFTVFIPEQDRRLAESLQQAMVGIPSELHAYLKIQYIEDPFVFEREQTGAVGAGTFIYYSSADGRDQEVSFGGLLVDKKTNIRYILTTSHLEDIKDKEFYIMDEDGNRVSVGYGVAWVCQTNPFIEACLIKFSEEQHPYEPKLLNAISSDSNLPNVFSGPYKGPLPELLATPREVMKIGGRTNLTRGRMRYYAFDFPDAETHQMMYGGIVTFPLDSKVFSGPGDCGAFICTAACQSFNVEQWVQKPDNMSKSVYGHDVISMHCFSYKIRESNSLVKVSISFRVSLALERLQSQINGELNLVPVLSI